MLLDIYKQIAVKPVSSDGVWLIDAQGQRYLDYYGGHAVALLGYGHPALMGALSHQARTLFFQSNAVELQVRTEAAEKLAALAPPALNRVFFVNSGAEANENALRVAFKKTGRSRVVAVEGAFHGRTAGAAACTHPNEAWYGFPRSPFDVTFVAFDDVAALKREIKNDVAAVIFEPVQGLAGARALSKEFVAEARLLTKQQGACLIFDEVQCGMGRTGYPFAAHYYDVVPDLLTTAKGLAGGFPAGALLMTESCSEGLKPGHLGTTFGGGPMACALISAVADVLSGEGFLQRVRTLSQRLLTECVGAGPVIATQGMGYLIGLKTSIPAVEVIRQLLERGIIAGESRDANVVRLLPPLVLQDEHVTELITALKSIQS